MVVPALQRGNESRQLQFFTVSDLRMTSKELPRGHTLGSASQLAGAERVGDRLKSLGDEGARYAEQFNQASEMRQRGGCVDWSCTKIGQGSIKIKMATYRMPKSHLLFSSSSSTENIAWRVGNSPIIVDETAPKRVLRDK